MKIWLVMKGDIDKSKIAAAGVNSSVWVVDILDIHGDI